MAEGNSFQDVPQTVESPLQGSLFAAPSTSANTVCTSTLGRVCQLNAFGNSGKLTGSSSTSFLSNFKGKNVASAAAASGVAASVLAHAGVGKL